MPARRSRLIAMGAPVAALLALAGTGWAADTQPAPKGPFAPTWDSIRANYKTPDWLRDAKFGIFMHWGLYSVPAHGSEWYIKYMYGGNAAIVQWHTQKFGAPDVFGYKDFIPLFTCAKFKPDEWATLFKKAGAKYIVPTAEHHDGWAMWDSDLTRWCAAKMGPKRDLIGELCKAVRAQGMKFGVSSHRMEHYSFIQPPASLKCDATDSALQDFYWVNDHSPALYQKFLEDWVARQKEVIDKYQVDMLWFDNGVNSRNLDPQKLEVAAYYYNRATEWGKQVTISTKSSAYLAGSMMDYEREGRAPTVMQPQIWQADDPIGEKFGYVEGMALTNAPSLIVRLVENTSKNGNLLLNISPMADGTIPEAQQTILLGVGKWLDQNSEAIYGSRPWVKFGEGPAADAATAQSSGGGAAAGRGTRGAAPATTPADAGAQELPAAPAAGGQTAIGGGGIPRGGYKPTDFRFTRKGDVLYVFAMAWPGQQAVIKSLALDKVPGKVDSVTMLGHDGALTYTQDADGLKVTMPAEKPGATVWVMKVTGLKLP